MHSFKNFSPLWQFTIILTKGKYFFMREWLSVKGTSELIIFLINFFKHPSYIAIIASVIYKPIQAIFISYISDL